ncbi:AAA domain-containing protein [Cephalotus follicularis]|uniref:AAA domain-containing protein n=1 Tax=Cephalotus follicularis TaxID=3775 RepID=A0A1Q3BG68_CEPFO|nr:AAA domain-containing protein [Cephalotus follicularis]
MPSARKKQSKSVSRLSNSDHSASPRTPSATSPQDFDVSEEDIRCSLEEAAHRFPALIGKSALIGRVTDVESESIGCKIWLSEPSMVASSLVPGSIVSVSFAASTTRFSYSFPLDLLSDEYGRLSEFGSGGETAKTLGTYFALATVFPSSKVLKNGARLSLNLSYTMGCPASGRVVFVYPVQNHSTIDVANGDHKSNNVKVNHLCLHNCKELYLKLASDINGVKMNRDTSSGEKVHDQLHNVFSSPKTPSFHPNLTFSNTSLLANPICKEAASNLLNPRSLCVDSFDIKEVLTYESAKKLLQTCATYGLYSRCLLYGNIVAIPILSDLCMFHVVGAKKALVSDDQVMMIERSTSLNHQALEPMDNVNDAFVINHETKIKLCLPSNSVSATSHQGGLSHLRLECEDVISNVGHYYSKIGGLSKEYAILKDIVMTSSTTNSLSSFGLRTTKGVLLHGPPGTGKTSLVRLCARDVGVRFFSINGPEIITQYYGESEQALHEVFNSASQAVPAVVFIDELDAIAPARKDGGEELSQRMVATLLNLMDGISRTDGVLVIAATNRPDVIEPALRRPGRLDKEIEIGVPSPKQRLDILHTLLSEMKHSLVHLQVQQLATTTHGFVGADLAALCNEAALVCLRRFAKIKKSGGDLHSNGTVVAYESCSDSIVEGSDCLVSNITDNFQNGNSTSSKQSTLMEEESILQLIFEDFEKARMKVRPSAMREVILEVPKVNWDDVGGQREVKTQLMEAVEWPQKHQDAFKRIGTRPPTGVLMFGPPGCSKTLMARAVASEAGLNFLAVKGPELFSKWVGESEKAVRSLFSKARANAPSIIFFDEIDGFAVIRGRERDGVSVSDRVMSQLLVELDGLHQRVDVTVIAATNRPDKIDPALLRPGRFDRLLYVGPPNETDREEIFCIHLRKIPCSSDVSIKELACLTEGYTGADISLICREAAVAAIEESLDAAKITMRHFKIAIRQVQPLKIQSYQELSARFQRLVHSEDKSDDQQCSSRSNWFFIWRLIKSLTQIVYRFPAAILSHSKSTSIC